MDGITLQEHFACLDDPRVDRTKHHQSTSHYHHRIMCGDLRSGYLGRCRRIRKGEMICTNDEFLFVKRISFSFDSPEGIGIMRLLIPPHCVQQKVATSVNRLRSSSAMKYTCRNGRTLMVISVFIKLTFFLPQPQFPPPSTHITDTLPGQSAHPSYPASP